MRQRQETARGWTSPFTNDVTWEEVVGTQITGGTIGPITGSTGTITFGGGTGTTISNCYITTGSAATSGITISNTCNWIVNAGSNEWTDAGGWVWKPSPPPPKWLEQPGKNHRGVLIRSHGSERQFDGISQAEMLALQLLRSMVGQDEFRRYLKHGHVHVRAESGLVYQIARHRTIQVWDRGVKIASLCVHLKHEHGTPPTDEVVGKMLIVECDEPDIWKRSNVTWLTEKRHAVAGDKTLTKHSGIYIGRAVELIQAAV